MQLGFVYDSQEEVEENDDSGSETGDNDIGLPDNSALMPAAIRSLDPLRGQNYPDVYESFLRQEIMKMIGGTAFGQGYFTVTKETSENRGFPGLTNYVLIDANFQPFAPKQAGDHGAKIEAYMKFEKARLSNTPVFYKVGSDYIYLGNSMNPTRPNI